MPRPISNPPNPWESTHVEWLGPAPPARLEVFEERAKSALSKNDSPDVPFRWSVNPYRGCQHACAYCYARRTHPYLGLGAGTDFDKKIVVKTNLPEILTRELARPSWRGESVVFSGVTDCYQPLEASYRLTRRCLEACLEHTTPVGVITKSALVRRDTDLLAALARDVGARVYVSIPFARSDSAGRIEPGTPTPRERFRAIRALADAGVPCGVSVSPLIPGLNDSDVPEILERARDAGATTAFLTLLRLPGEVQDVFRERLEEAYPDRTRRVFSALDEMRSGNRGDTRFRKRMHGEGERWKSTRRLFEVHCRRFGLRTDEEELRPVIPRNRDGSTATSGKTARPRRARREHPAQGGLFDSL